MWCFLSSQNMGGGCSTGALAISCFLPCISQKASGHREEQLPLITENSKRQVYGPLSYGHQLQTNLNYFNSKARDSQLDLPISFSEPQSSAQLGDSLTDISGTLGCRSCDITAGVPCTHYGYPRKGSRGLRWAVFKVTSFP